MLREANKAFSKLWSMPVKLKFPNLGNLHKLQVVGYADATYASLGDGSSQGAYLIFLQGDNRRIAPISWQSKNPIVTKLWPLVRLQMLVPLFLPWIRRFLVCLHCQ